ncbi:putative disease resistance protein At1g63350 [Bidens hawaiensis]|uniref:putative disease resistance protein At1g63350 n=1 Tax=Bidens hawaiensis TaxID=980011 RepID=UPI004049554B
MDFVTPIITPIVQSLLVPVNRHLGFLVSSLNYVRNLRAKVTKLDCIAHDMHDKQASCIAKGVAVPHQVPVWLAEVEKIKERSERIPTGGVGCFNLKMRYKMGKQSDDIIKVIDGLMNEKAEMVWEDVKIPLAMVTSPSSLTVLDDYQNQNINRIKSRDLIFSDALKSLESNNKTGKMAICGMAGVGKTTMMEQLKRAANYNNMFDWIVKVDVGKNPNLDGIQQIIAEYTGENLMEKSKDARAERLKKRFEGMSEHGKKKFLVILDDVWETINVKDIGLTNPLSNGFKLLLTTREETVCTQMGVEASAIFKLVVLEEPEAKKLFWEIAGLAVDEPDLHQIGEDIVKKCGGLSIAINTIASTLRENKEKDEWKDALFRLRNNKIHVLINIFELSYQNLNDDDVKEIFLLSGLYPEDYNIVIEELVLYGWGLNFYTKVPTIETARSRGITCVNKLIRSNLLIKSDREGCVKMHDLVHEFVLSNFSKVKQASIVNHDNNVSEQFKEDESYERILLKCGDMLEFPVNFNYRNLALLRLMGGHKLLKFPVDFYARMEKLEVVAYTSMHLPLLPTYSTNLRALILRSCKFLDNDISFLGDLINLEVLSIAYCGIHKLPSKLGKLKRLKLLDLTGCVDLCIDDGVFQSMQKLQELYMRVSDKKTIRFTDTNCDELNMRSINLRALEVEFFENKAQPKYVSFKKLERFGISVGCFLPQKWGSDRDLNSFKNTLKLVTSYSELLECKINELFRKTEVLYLHVRDMEHLEDISTHPLQHSFCNLKTLHVCGSQDLTCLFTIPVAKGLTKLESLVISSCPALKEIWSCEITNTEEVVNYISMLRNMQVEDCSSLVNLFPGNLMQLLSRLEKLSVQACGIEVLFNMDLLKIEQISSNLKSIHVWNCYNFREMWRIQGVENTYPGLLIHGFHAVESICIERCERFRNIVIPATANFDMKALKDIRIVECGEYDEKNNEFVNNSQEEKSNTVSKEEISKVDDKMSILGSPLYQTTHNIHHLRRIELNRCKRVKVLFEMRSPGNRQLVRAQQKPLPLLPYLEQLNLEHMGSLSHVWKCRNWNEFFNFHKHQPQSSFQNLTSVSLYFCKRIKYLYSPFMVNFLSNLKEVRIRYCDNMEEVVSHRDDEDEEMTTSISAHTTTTMIHHLDLLGLSNLKHIGGGFSKANTNASHGQSKLSQVGDPSWSLCEYAREIRISNCNALSSIIPSYSAGRMQKLQSLSIQQCDLVKEVFETIEISNNNISGCSSTSVDPGSDDNDIVSIPRSRNITIHNLPNLKILKIMSCWSLENIFTLSTLESLKKLEMLTIEKCWLMKVIVREDYGEQATTTSKKVVFPHLKSIELEGLSNLSGFFLGLDVDFEWPALDYVKIKNCPSIMKFTSGQSKTPRLKYIHTELGKHNLDHDLNFHVKPMLPQIIHGSL